MEYTYQLEKYKGLKSRHTCPACQYRHEFARYIDADGNYLADEVGRCNRESKCGYHLTPKDFLNGSTALISKQITPANEKQNIDFINPEILKATLKAYENNTFVKHLNHLFSQTDVTRLIDMYGLGTSKDGSCIFWQVDQQGQVRTGKAIRYKEDGHRDKDHKPYFIHSKLGLNSIEQCLFGLHLMTTEPAQPIGIVESEKTAVIMAGTFPEILWMATGGKSAAITSKLLALKGKKVVCFPDSDAFDEWNKKLSPLGFAISRALDALLTQEEKVKGYDLADFVNKNEKNYERLIDGTLIEMNPQGFPLSWA